jgi:hypothetical protein
MRMQFLVAVGVVLSTAASAQDWKSAIEKWRGCADAAAARYSKSNETAQEVARLAALACGAEKTQAVQAVSQSDGVAFAEEYIETAERHYMDRLSVNVVEMRLRGTEKR